MALDQIKRLQTAEELLKQGRTDEALTELRRLAEESPNDLLTLNRMGDMLARQGRVDDALGYYREIGEKFASTGYLHKAVAIFKKMLRLAPDSTDSLAAVGRLYIRQKLPAEGARYLLAAADRFVSAKDFAAARGVYEELIVTDPQNPLHRARLAEALAAGGDADGAGRELVRLADSLRSQGRWEDAEKTYRRASEICPDWQDPVLGASACLHEQGRTDEAIGLLEQALNDGKQGVAGELVLRCEMGGREARVIELLNGEIGARVPPETIEHLFLYHGDRGDVGALWKRLDPVFEMWGASWPPGRMAELFERLAGIESEGHRPAMERMVAWLAGRSDHASVVPALERLVRRLQSRGMDEPAQNVLGWLRKVAPQSSALAGAARQAAASGGVEGEAPAVPLNRADRDFVTGRLTQAEILEKYSLVDQAVQQVRDVTTRFPGHVDAQKRLAKLLRAGGDARGVAEALAGLAVACRAEGNAMAARSSAADALATGLLDAGTISMLEGLGLAGAVTAAPKAPEARVAPAKPSSVKHAAAQPVAAEPGAAQPAAATQPVAAPPRAAAPPAPLTLSRTDDELVLDLDAGGDDDAVVVDLDGADAGPVEALAAAPPDTPPATTSAAASESREPSREMLEEIDFYLAQGRIEDARQRVDTLHDLGYSGAELEQLCSALIEAESLAEIGLAPEAPRTEVRLTDDDLSTITAALEGELAEDEGPVEPDAGSEQSIDQVFAAFRERVAEQVGIEDYRTHYELGIGYKEMGLLEEAVAEFEIAARSEDLLRESRVMLALCHRDLGQIDKAVEAYRAAMAVGGEGTGQVALQYDLGELLAESGDSAAALEVLREVLETAPGYRDVEERVRSLEASLAS